jgi:hypothetical protein
MFLFPCSNKYSEFAWATKFSLPESHYQVGEENYSLGLSKKRVEITLQFFFQFD